MSLQTHLAQSIQIGISIYRQPQHWIQQSIHSALCQTGPGSITVTVRTDGPSACTNETKLWLRALAANTRNLHLIEGLTQLGTYGSYREIFATSASEFLCQLDADDWLEPDATAKGVTALTSRQESPFAYTNYQEVSSDGEPLGIGARSQTPYSPERMLVQFITFHLRIIRRTAYNKCGGYKPGLLYTGDYDLSLRLCELGTPIHLSEVLYNYRQHSENTSTIQRQATIQEAFRVAQAALARRQQEHLYELRLSLPLCSVTLERRQGPILIAGMHRSGTSLLALMLQCLDLNLGNDLLAADNQNPDGYGEDLSVVNLQRQALQRMIDGKHHQPTPPGWPDWGWHEGSGPAWNRPPDARWHEEAQSYIHARKGSSGLWGWKDPRSTLFLESWLELVPGMKLIAVYRDPWAVVDALQRLQPPIFANHPEWALSIWCYYNQSLIRFVSQHPERCILLHSSVLTTNPEELINALKSHWNWPLSKTHKEHVRDLHSLIRIDRLRQGPASETLSALHRHCSPKAAALLNTLETIATLPSCQAKKVDHNIPMPQLGLTLRRPQPDLSIVITSYNQGDFLLEAIASCEKSCRTHRVELVIIDDGSCQARTIDVLDCLEELGYNVVRQPNQGLASARNAGAAKTTAPIILFLDDDNRLLSAYLEHGIHVLYLHNNLEVVYGNCKEFGSTSALRQVGAIRPSDLWVMNRIDNCTLMRRSFFERCGGYDPALPAFEDWDLWLTALGQDKGLCLGYLDMTCFEYRIRPDSMLQRLFRNPQLQKQVMEQLRRKHGNRVGHGGFA